MTGQLGAYLPTTNPYTKSLFCGGGKRICGWRVSESEIIDEEVERECVEDVDPLQGFVDQDSLPTYDEDINEEDSIEEPLASNLEEEHKEDEFFFFLMFGGLYPDEEDQLGDEEPTNDIADHEEDDIADYEEVDEGLSGEVFNL